MQPSLRHAVEELGGRDLQRPSKANDRRQPRVAPSTLEKRDLGPVEVAGVPERFLREAEPRPMRPEVLCETLPGLHTDHPACGQTEPLQTKPLPADRSLGEQEIAIPSSPIVAATKEDL